MQDDKTATPLRGIRYLLLWVPFWALMLNVLGASLTIPGGLGVEDYLGWAHPGAVEGMNSVWRGYALGPVPLTGVAGAYLALDTAVFMPFYGALLLALADKFLCATARDGRQPNLWLRPLVVGMVLVLLLADLVENLVGMGRLGRAGFAGCLLATALMALPMAWALRGRWKWWLDELPAFLARLDGRRTAIVVAAGLALGAAEAWRELGHDSGLAGADAVLAAGAFAHLIKTGALVLCAILLAGLAGAWFFGFCIPPGGDAHEERARLRRAVGDMLLRCRYVWFALAVFAGLALALNQGRDVLYSVAAMETGAAHQFGWVGGMVVFVVSAVGMWSFGFAAWLWSRSVCLMRSPQTAATTPTGALSHADRFARDLARLLGLLPPTLFVLLCGSTLHDALMAHKHGVALRMLLFIVAAIAGGAIFVYIHARDAGQRCFYDGYEFAEWDRLTRDRSHPRFHLFRVITPALLPWYAAGAMFGCRLVAVGVEAAGLGPWPPMVLATFLFTLTFWLSLFGWLSLNEQRIATPWGLLLVITVGALGYTDWMQNHRVGGLPGQAAPASDLVPTLVAGLLALICLLLFRALVTRARAERLTLWGGTWRVVVAMGAAAGVMFGGQQLAVEPEPKPAALERVTLDAALAGWLGELYARRGELAPRAGGAGLPVYFIDAEGGGIRNAYWTALVLDRLAAEVPDFHTRTFSYSGVSGGSVGLAVERACADKGGRPCLQGLGNADLITPLISTWLFEDVLAQILPTAFCAAPACGVLSRGVRFENAMLQAVPQLTDGIAAAHPASGAPHRPYLFLNSTWVESGERAIASKVLIDWRDFPAARDPLTLLRRDLSLATAAHNSARFPFINAIGALKVPDGNCRPEPTPADSQDKDKDKDKDKVCGHLADGGYFDNSGGHTTANLLAGLARCLSAAPGEACGKLGEAPRAWARQTLAPQVIQIRNGVRPAEDERASCVAPRPPRSAADVVPARYDRSRDLYQPGRPGCDGQMKLYGALLGPLVTAVNTTGIGANGKLAEADLRLQLANLAGQLQRSVPPVANIDLVEDGKFLYPLGWHLSPIAREGMQDQVCHAGLLQGVAGRGAPWQCPWPRAQP